MTINQVIKIVEFVVVDECTHCNIFFTSNYPDEPVFGCGWRTRSYPTTIPIADVLIKPEHGIDKYLEWEHGRTYYQTF